VLRRVSSKVVVFVLASTSQASRRGHNAGRNAQSSFPSEKSRPREGQAIRSATARACNDCSPTRHTAIAGKTTSRPLPAPLRMEVASRTAILVLKRFRHRTAKRRCSLMPVNCTHADNTYVTLAAHTCSDLGYIPNSGIQS